MSPVLDKQGKIAGVVARGSWNVYEQFLKQRQPYTSPRPMQSQPQPENTRYGEAKVHKNLTGIRLQGHTACTATHECLRTLLCCGVRLRNSWKYDKYLCAMLVL